DRSDRFRLLIAKSRCRDVEDRGQVLRVKVVTQLVQHVDENEGSGRRNSRPSGHRTLPLHRVVSPENKGHSVDQKDVRAGFGLWFRGQVSRRESNSPSAPRGTALEENEHEGNDHWLVSLATSLLSVLTCCSSGALPCARQWISPSAPTT